MVSKAVFIKWLSFLDHLRRKVGKVLGASERY
jgi:hypothetical protein